MARFHFFFAIMIFGGCSTMTTKPQTLPYLDWTPAIKPADIFQGAIGFTYVQTDSSNNAYWVEQRPSEEGRSVLVEANAKGEIRDLTPKPYSVRSRVFEYGSYPYVAHDGWVYFVNFSDQRLYKQSLADPNDVTALTPPANADGSLGKYADLAVSDDGKWLAFAYEKEVKSGEYPNLVGVIDLKHSGIQEARVVAEGASFYRSPLFAPGSSRIAWLQWNHPFMSWDSTSLMIASFAAVKVEHPHKVAGSDKSSISSFTFTADGELFYAIDHADESDKSALNFYNVHGFKNGKDRVVTKGLADYSSIRAQGAELICLRTQMSQNKIVSLNPATGSERELAIDYADLGAPAATSDGTIYSVGAPADRPSEMLKVSSSGTVEVLRKSAQFKVDPADVSRGELIKFPTEDGKVAYGYYYPPVNSQFKAPANDKPPVRVLVHGGPTAMTTNTFTLSKMFWTSQGYAIFDVNYRGSFGFGREYRDALRHKWGIVEIQDVKDGLAELARQGKISGQAVVSGGSAGGHTVQRLLTSYPDLFAAGASHFGIGNLVTLQKLTHKLESHYLEQLIGGTLDTNLKEYEDRSPINHLEGLKAPMIIFQGSDDKVVPPENSREMAEILKKKGIEYEYYEYPGEGHGFRKKENLLGSLEKEAAFFKRVLKRAPKP